MTNWKYYRWLIEDRFLTYFRNYPLSYYYHLRYQLKELWGKLLRRPKTAYLLILDEFYIWLEKRKEV